MSAKHTLLLLALAGCPDRTIAEVPVDQVTVELKDVPAVPKRDIDILFVIDDSGSMVDEQASLIANFANMIAVLESIEGGLPDVQIGVITPNLGTSAIDGSNAGTIQNCGIAGEGGVLRPLGTGGPRFIRDVADGAGGRDRNYTGTLADAFRQLATVGTGGCGVEQHLEAMKRATDGSRTENAGFLRPNAYLAVIVIADEDDCSLAKSSLWTAFPQGADYGKKLNFRCISQAIECETPATDFETATGPREDCHPKADPGELTTIDRYVDHLKSLKPDPRDIVVAGIIGDPENFEIVKDGTVTQVGNACLAGSNPDAEAYPAVRTNAFLSEFPLSARSSICNQDLSGALTRIGALIKKLLIEPCFDRDLLDVDPVTPGPQYDCSVTEVRRRPGQDDEELTVVPPCDGERFPCWRIEEDAQRCGYTQANPHLKLVVERGGVAPDPNLRIKAACVTGNASGPFM
jgi:hypothetical protein